jgi:AmmeMemoRadiSam system protein A
MSNKDYTKEQKDEILSFVKNIIKNKLEGIENATITPIPEHLKEERSCFVTLHTASGALRGCIGHIMAFEPLYDNLRRNALNAALQDPRFSPVKSIEEFSSINVEVSILTPAEKVDSYSDIIIGEHGVILKNGSRNAVFLPQVTSEQGWDIQTTLMHLSMKAGLPPNAWELPETQFEVFRAIVFNDN